MSRHPHTPTPTSATPQAQQPTTLTSEACPVLGPSPLRALRDEAAVCPVRTPAGDPAWLVTRHEEVKQLLHDERLGRAHPDPEAAPKYVDSPLLDLLILDDVEQAREMHAQVRGLLTPQFSARRMRALKPRIEELAAELADALAARDQPADLHRHFSLPFSLRILQDLLGVPDAYRGRCATLLAGIGRVDDDRGEDDRTAGTAAKPDEAQADDSTRGRATGPEAATDPSSGPGALFALLAEIAAAKRADPADDVISGLTAAGVPDVQAGALAANLLFAGLESVASHIDLGVVLLAVHPEQRAAALDGPAGPAGLVEEVLRSAKRSGSTLPRYATDDIEVAGVTIRAGELVLLDFALANYDERTFEDPETFDMHRAPNPHLAFGHGIWYCIGASLARIELTAAFTALFDRLPQLVPAEPAERLLTQSGQLVGGLAELPVVWDRTPATAATTTGTQD